MASISFQRPLQLTQDAYAATISAGILSEQSGKFYLPFTFDSFSAPNLSITAISWTGSVSTLSGAAAKFDNVRVGDELSAVSAGTLTAKAAVAKTGMYTVNAKPYMVYPSTYSSTTLGVTAGDVVDVAGVPANTKVDRIDYTERRIYLTANCTASAVVDPDFLPPIRVTAVRKSDATLNPNQIDIDGTTATTGANATLTIVNGAREAVFAIVRFVPLSDTSGSKLTFQASVSYLTGATVVGSANGLNGIDPTTLNYTEIGRFSLNGDEFLTAARLPRTNNA